MTELYLYVKQGAMYAIENSAVKNNMKKHKLQLSDVFARLIDSENIPRITFTDLANSYTIISDDDGIVTAEHLYVIKDIDGTNYNIPGTCIFAKLDSLNNILPLNDEDQAYLKANLPIRCCNMPEYN